MDDVGALRRKIEDAAFAESWDVAHQMVDERRTRIWATSTLSQSSPLLGIERLPEQVVVGLLLVWRNRSIRSTTSFGVTHFNARASSWGASWAMSRREEWAITVLPF